MNNINNVCLVCLCNRDQNLLNQVLYKGKENEIVTYLKYVFPELPILYSESSVYICSSCHTPLQSFYKFKKQCLDNYNRLTHYTQDTSNIQEQKQSFSDIQNSNEPIIKQEKQGPYIDLNITPEKISALLGDDKESAPVAEPEMVIIPSIKVENDSLSFSNEEETVLEDFMDYTEEDDEQEHDDINFKEESFSSDDSADRELYQQLVKNESVSDNVQDDSSAGTSASEVNNSNEEARTATQKLQCSNITVLQDRLRKIKCVTLIGLAALVAQHCENKRRRKRSSGVRNRIEKRNTTNIASVSLVHDELASEDPFPYKNYLGMDKLTFLKLLCFVKPHIEQNETNICLSITARDSLIVTLRFLATGESYQDIMYSTRIPATTLSKIIPECCEVIHNVLKDKYLKVPNSEDEWNSIADAFLRKWNIPNCIGALDGKHVEFESSMQSNSLVLLALVDANYKFIYVHAEKNGKHFKDSNLNTALYKNILQIPPEKPLPGCVSPVPYVFVADGTFPLQKHIMKPFPKRSSTMEQGTYNYRISRAHKVVENGFGILSNRFRIFLTRIKLNPETVETIILTCCALHNFLKDESPDYITSELVDREDDDGNLVLGSWRNDVTQMRTVAFQYGRPSIPVLEIRNEFKKYFNGIGRVPWQNNEQY